MHPILFEIGSFQIPSYGAAMVAGFLVSWYLLQKEAERMDMNRQKIADAAVIALLSGLLGAKLLLILVDLPYYLENPAALKTTIRSAGVIYGGQIGGALGTIWYIKRHKLPFWKTIDLMTPFLALGIGLGRISCLLAGCCHGFNPYDGPFAITYPNHPQCDAPPFVGVFPIQVIALVNGIVLFLILRQMLRNRKFDGQIIFAFVVLYGITRGLMEFLRGDSVRGLWLGGTLSTSQIIALTGIGLGSYMYLKKRKEAAP